MGSWPPHLAELNSMGEKAKIGSMYYRVTRWDLMATLPLFVLYLVLARPMMAVFGPEFGEGAMAVAILAVGQLVNIGTGPVGTLLMMTGYQRIVLWANLGQCLLAAGLLLLLTPYTGLLGAAIASGLSTSLYYIGLYLYARRHSPLRIYNYHTARLLISSTILGFLAWRVRSPRDAGISFDRFDCHILRPLPALGIVGVRNFDGYR